jgi:hypothetical protein
MRRLQVQAGAGAGAGAYRYRIQVQASSSDAREGVRATREIRTKSAAALAVRHAAYRATPICSTVELQDL